VRVSLLNGTRMHQQPVIVAPHVKSLPQASHVDGSFQRSDT
jgi:hypothetical protein